MTGTPERHWEVNLGSDTVERTQRLGQNTRDYRNFAGLPPVDKHKQLVHDVYIHSLGGEILKTKLSRQAEIDQEREKLRRKETKVGKLLRRKIRVADFEDGGIAVTIDSDWDTSTWSKEQIEAGCEALILIFYDPEGNSNLERKERAVQMLQKLLFRHPAAQAYIRRNVEQMIGKAANKIIRGGRCCGLLDLLYILQSCKDTFITEMSFYNFNGKALEMMIQEAKLAAILIQHTYRARRNRLQLVHMAIPRHEGFGTFMEVKATRLAVVNARSFELRAKWRSMHWMHSEKRRQLVGGVRGPIHMGPEYTALAMDIILHLISEKAGSQTHGNREDIVRSNGCVLLSTYIASPTGQFAFIAARMMSNVSLVAESFDPVLKTGCVYSCVKLLKYLRLVGVGGPNAFKEKNKHVVFTHDEAAVDATDVLINTAKHAAGFYRADNNYDYTLPDIGLVEKVDYKDMATHITSRGTIEQAVVTYLGGHRLLQELSTFILFTKQPLLLGKLLKLLLCVLSTYSHNNAVMEITAMGGVLMIRIVELLHNQDNLIASLALCIFSQICTRASSREQLLIARVREHLNPMNRYPVSIRGGGGGDRVLQQSQVYHNLSCQRSLAAAVCLARTSEWPLVSPETLIESLTRKDGVRQFIIVHLLRTIKCHGDLTNWNVSAKFQIADLVVLPTHEESAINMSKNMEHLCPAEIAAFICHPNEPGFIDSIPVEEMAAAGTILEALCAHPETAYEVYSQGTVNFFGKFLFLAKYMFLGKPLMNGQITVILNGVRSAMRCMSRLSLACIPRSLANTLSKVSATCLTNVASVAAKSAVFSAEELKRCDSLVQTVRLTEIVASSEFFLNTLAVQHPKLTEDTRKLQTSVGRSCLEYFDSYAAMINAVHIKSTLVSLNDLFGAGSATTKLLVNLKAVHGRSKAILGIFEQMCELLSKLTRPKSVAYIALHEWKLGPALQKYLPPVLSSLSGVEEALSEISMFASEEGCREDEKSDMRDAAAGGANGDYDNDTMATDNITPSSNELGLGGGESSFPSPSHNRQDSCLGSPSPFQTGGGSNGEKRESTYDLSSTTRPAPASSLARSNTASSSTSRAVTAARQQADVDEEQTQARRMYRISVFQLPCSFFNLCANLCQTDLGIRTCLADGILRLTLQRTTIMFSAFNDLRSRGLLTEELVMECCGANKEGIVRRKIQRGNSGSVNGKGRGGGEGGGTSSGPPSRKSSLLKKQSSFSGRKVDSLQMPPSLYNRESTISNWSKTYDGFVSCFSVIARATNYHSPTTGNANDVILLPDYGIVELCAELIRFPALPRSCSLITTSLEVLAQLAQDTHRSSKLLEASDVFMLLRDNFFHLESDFNNNVIRSGGAGGNGVQDGLLVPVQHNANNLTEYGATAALNVLMRGSTGLASDYINECIPSLREPLFKVARVLPNLNGLVREVNWMLTKSAMIYRAAMEEQAHESGFFGNAPSSAARIGADSSNGGDKSKRRPLKDDEIEEFIRSGKKGNVFHIPQKEAKVIIEGNMSMGSIFPGQRASHEEEAIEFAKELARLFGNEKPPLDLTGKYGTSVTDDGAINNEEEEEEDDGNGGNGGLASDDNGQRPISRAQSSKQSKRSNTGNTSRGGVSRRGGRTASRGSTAAAAAAMGRTSSEFDFEGDYCEFAGEVKREPQVYAKPGTYLRCGVSTCGGLHIAYGEKPPSAAADELFAKATRASLGYAEKGRPMSRDEAMAGINDTYTAGNRQQHAHAVDDVDMLNTVRDLTQELNLCQTCQLSARDPMFRQVLAERKMHYSFRDSIPDEQLQQQPQPQLSSKQHTRTVEYADERGAFHGEIYDANDVRYNPNQSSTIFTGDSILTDNYLAAESRYEDDKEEEEEEEEQPKQQKQQQQQQQQQENNVNIFEKRVATNGSVEGDCGNSLASGSVISAGGASTFSSFGGSNNSLYSRDTNAANPNILGGYKEVTKDRKAHEREVLGVSHQFVHPSANMETLDVEEVMRTAGKKNSTKSKKAKVTSGKKGPNDGVEMTPAIKKKRDKNGLNQLSASTASMSGTTLAGGCGGGGATEELPQFSPAKPIISISTAELPQLILTRPPPIMR